MAAQDAVNAFQVKPPAASPETTGPDWTGRSVSHPGTSTRHPHHQEDKSHDLPFPHSHSFWRNLEDDAWGMRVHLRFPRPRLIGADAASRAINAFTRWTCLAVLEIVERTFAGLAVITG